MKKHTFAGQDYFIDNPNRGRRKLSREEMETVFNILSDSYSQNDDSRTVVVTFVEWPSIDRRFYKQLKQLLEDYKDQLAYNEK